ncbi:LOW QUALITY PROTEIN: hypothetical protein BT93_B0927 [Corymbia citriodora subsp. variegata]|nr:LOW QUALITY PROTEIN: hypothetical protein BT93_B0927 [Corymbia citriodora subsp. variegata]
MTKSSNMNDSNSPQYRWIAFYWQDSNETTSPCHILLHYHNHHIHMKYIMQRSIMYHKTTHYSLHV